MTAHDAISWVGLCVLMTHGLETEPTIHGTIRSQGARDESRGHAGFSMIEGDEMAVLAGSGFRPETGDGSSMLRVWRDGSRIRIEEPDGSPNLIIGDGVSWNFDRDHEAPMESSRADIRAGFRGTGLLWRRELGSFAGTDFTRPTGPVGSTTFLGRPAWTVELAPPSHKPYPLQLVVDAETGFVLQQRNDGFGSVDEWLEFVVGEPLEPKLFTWSGPVRSEADIEAARRASFEADMASRRAWFTANVSAEPLHVQLEPEVHVHEHDEDGAFQASIGNIGSLARRPRSSDEWDLGWQETQHRWTDAKWDWALTIYETPLSLEAFEAIRRSLSAS